MKNLIILLQLLSMVQPRGLDPKYYGRDVGANYSAIFENVFETSSKPASDGFSFINNFLSSENTFPKEASDNTNTDHSDITSELGTNRGTFGKTKEDLRLDKIEDSEKDRRDYSVLFGRGGPVPVTSLNVGQSQREGREEDTSPNKLSLDVFMSTFLKSQSSSKSYQNSISMQKTAKSVHPEENRSLSQPVEEFEDYNQDRQRNDNFLTGKLEDGYHRQREFAPLTPAIDRQLLIPFTPVDIDFVEAKYQGLIHGLPILIDEAREVIRRDIATKNMMGYTIAGSFFIGAFLETVGGTLLDPKIKSFGDVIVQLITNKELPGFYIFLWGYAFGYAGPWLFPTIFNGGDPNLKCSSADFFQLMNDHDLTLDIQSFTELSVGANVILVEKVSRDFNSRLGCIVNKRGDYKEAALAAQAFETLIFLTSLHGQLSDIPPPDPTPRDIVLLDSELLNLWAEIILITDQVMNKYVHPRLYIQ